MLKDIFIDAINYPTQSYPAIRFESALQQQYCVNLLNLTIRLYLYIT